MDHSDNETPRLSVQEQAAQWFVRSKDERLSVSDRRALVRWQRRSPQNLAEMFEVVRIYALLRQSKLASEPWNGDDGATSNVVNVFGCDKPAAIPPKPKNSLHRWKVAAAASIAALVIVVVGVIAKVAWLDRTIATAASEWRTQVLADGSTVRLGPRTRLRIDFGENRRSIELARGEALFQVAKDARRPFIVDAAMADVRAVGTEFGVTRHDGDVIVTVAEGTVAVFTSPSDAVNWHSRASVGDPRHIPGVTVSAGQQVAVSAARMMPVHAVNVTRELAWVHGQLIFEDTPVREAIEEFNRRNRLQIEVEDRAIAAREVGGVFNAADPQSFAEFLHAVAPITIVRDGSDVLRLEAASGPGRQATQRLHAQTL